jgi:hypothetical protein
LGQTGSAFAAALFGNANDYANRDYVLKSMIDGSPNMQMIVHDIGRMSLTVTNSGTFGTSSLGTTIIDGEIALSCEYPINSNIEYLFNGALWIGAVVGRDTLVSVAFEGWFGIKEFFPDAGLAGNIITRTNLKTDPDYSDEAVSEQDFICTYTDTFTASGLTGEDPIDNRPHIPLNVSVEQNSYAWSYEYAEDFVLFDYKITNIGIFPIRDLYLAIYVDAVAYHKSIEAQGFKDDVCGFRRTVPMPANMCIDEDTVNIAWIADNDGDPFNEQWDFRSPIAVTGTQVIRTPNDNLRYSFNWWISNTIPSLDFGPRMAGTDEYPFRSFGTHLGTPTGDRNKYSVMSRPEFDYDQLFSAVSHTDLGYLEPPRPDAAIDFANGYDTRYLLSFGPFDVWPGDTLPITLAYLAGDNFHINPNDYRDYYDPLNPYVYYNRLNFDDLGLNARWAAWIFDNPGYDTPTKEYPEGDGDSGKFCWNFIWAPDTVTQDPVDSIIIDSQKVYYAGDGVPDFRGAAPPPPPAITVTPGFGEVTIRWNGQLTENSYDVFSGEKDFEGYRIYYSRSDRLSDFVLLTSYDLDDYKVFEFISRYDSIYWEQVSLPITLDSLRILYGANFDPNEYYDEMHYFNNPYSGRIYYFVRQDWNQSDLRNPLLIHKVYPDASPDDLADTTAEGLLRYYEYEYKIDNLQPSVPYHFAVTAFDFGSLRIDLGSLESSPLINAVEEYPLPSTEVVEDRGLKVTVYPNPYRINGGYARAGYENRDRTKSAERARLIHFSNLPRICRIRIYSIDGDLIQTIDHYYPGGGPGSQHEEWNVISRNTQAVVTGIYIWHVDSEMGEQLGKLVIIR